MVSHAIRDKCESGGLNKMCKSDLGKCSEKNLKELSYTIQTHQIKTLSKQKMKQVLKETKNKVPT